MFHILGLGAPFRNTGGGMKKNPDPKLLTRARKTSSDTHTFGGVIDGDDDDDGWGSKSVYSLHNSSFNLSACFCSSSDSSCYPFASLLLLLLYHTWLIFSLASSFTSLHCLPWPHSWLSLTLWKKLVSKQFFFWSFLLLLLYPTLLPLRIPFCLGRAFPRRRLIVSHTHINFFVFCCCWCWCFEKGDKKNV